MLHIYTLAYTLETGQTSRLISKERSRRVLHIHHTSLRSDGLDTAVPGLAGGDPNERSPKVKLQETQR